MTDKKIWTGIATSAQVAERAAMKAARKSGKRSPTLKSIERVAGDIDFGL